MVLSTIKYFFSCPKLTLNENSVNFDLNKSSLTSTAKANLDKLVPVFNQYPDTNIQIYGYTDSTGAADYNLKLSDQRAASVKAYLASKGLVATRFVTTGLGIADPIATNDTPEGRSKNRRVEFAITANEKMVQDAQGSKAPVQKMLDKIASIFVPIVIAIALLALIVWMVFGGENGFTQGLLALVTVLVIACPCALGLATPTAIMVGVGKGAEEGILIKDAESLELSKKINAIILDKTGTITQGKPTVTDVIWTEETEIAKQILVAIERQSEHPLAEAVVNHFKEEILVTIHHMESITGKGVKAHYNGVYYFVGNKKLLVENGISISEKLEQEASQWLAAAKTVIWFANDKNTLAVLAIADEIKVTSKAAIEAFQDMNIEVYMLTGDNANTAKAVAEQVGITHYKGEVLPKDKADFVKELQAKGKIVAMVGDGINDSTALAQANVSIAMGKGSDIAIDVAKMTIISSDLSKIPLAIKISTKTVNTIKQNLFWAFIYNIIGIPIAAGILYPINGFLLNPMIAGAAMALSSVSVVANSLRLKYFNN